MITFTIVSFLPSAYGEHLRKPHTGFASAEIKKNYRFYLTFPRTRVKSLGDCPNTCVLFQHNNTIPWRHPDILISIP